MENNIQLEDLNPTYQLVARVIGVENAIKLGKELGGEHFYLPKWDVCQAKARRRKIIEEFKAGNYRELAKKYGVTSRWVRDIINEHRRKKASNAR